MADVRLEVLTRPEVPRPAHGPKSDFLNGRIEVTGTLALECKPGENPVRPGMLGMVLVTGPDRRLTRLPSVFLDKPDISVPAPGLRTYGWSFLLVAAPTSDPQHLIPRFPGDFGVLPEGEISLADLLKHYDGELDPLARTAVQFNSEGGFELVEV